MPLVLAAMKLGLLLEAIPAITALLTASYGRSRVLTLHPLRDPPKLLMTDLRAPLLVLEKLRYTATPIPLLVAALVLPSLLL